MIIFFYSHYHYTKSKCQLANFNEHCDSFKIIALKRNEKESILSKVKKSS